MTVLSFPHGVTELSTISSLDSSSLYLRVLRIFVKLFPLLPLHTLSLHITSQHHPFYCITCTHTFCRNRRCCYVSANGRKEEEKEGRKLFNTWLSPPQSRALRSTSFLDPLSFDPSFWRRGTTNFNSGLVSYSDSSLRSDHNPSMAQWYSGEWRQLLTHLPSVIIPSLPPRIKPWSINLQVPPFSLHEPLNRRGRSC